MASPVPPPSPPSSPPKFASQPAPGAAQSSSMTDKPPASLQSSPGGVADAANKPTATPTPGSPSNPPQGNPGLQDSRAVKGDGPVQPSRPHNIVAGQPVPAASAQTIELTTGPGSTTESAARAEEARRKDAVNPERRRRMNVHRKALGDLIFALRKEMFLASGQDIHIEGAHASLRSQELNDVNGKLQEIEELFNKHFDNNERLADA